MPRLLRRTSCLGAVVTLLAFSVQAGRADTVAQNADTITLSLTGEITSSPITYPMPTITPQIGDPFQLTLTFWRTDAPYTKTVNGNWPDYTQRGAVSEQLTVNGITYFGGQNFTSFDTYSALSLTNGLLSFAATDQGYGALGSATVGADFPTNWFADIQNPLPNGQTVVDFNASGHFDYYYGFYFPSLSGTITGGSVAAGGSGTMADALAAPEPASMCVLLAAGVLLLRRRPGKPTR